MKTKWIISGILLLFVFVAVGFAVTREMKQGKDVNATTQTDIASAAVATTADSQGAVSKETPAVATPSGTQSPKLIAYYFHATARCVSCKTIEALSREALEQGFAKELRDGEIEWRILNVEEPDNRHFIADYQLNTMSLVLVEMKDGKPGRSKNLKDVWQLLKDKIGFINYVKTEVRLMLNG